MTDANREPRTGRKALLALLGIVAAWLLLSGLSLLARSCAPSFGPL